MQKLRERLKDQKGFTLVEMLIVVAIIAILIAVSIPMVNSSLEKAREAVDDANLRDAIGLGNIYYLTETDSITSSVDLYYYVNDTSHQGQLGTDDGKDVSGTALASGFDKVTGQSSTYSSNNIKVTIKSDGTVTAAWE